MQHLFPLRVTRVDSSRPRRSCRNQPTETSTSWTDLLLFIALGILAIVVLDLFFKFGKTVVESNNNKNYNTYPQSLGINNSESIPPVQFSKNPTMQNVSQFEQPSYYSRMSENPTNYQNQFTGGNMRRPFFNYDRRYF